MDKIIEKIGEYSIVTCLLPGVFFCFLCDKLFGVCLVLEDGIVENVFIYYLWGLVISRIGALFLEPLLLKCKIVQQYDYNDYIEATKADDKIATFLQINNLYRTMLAVGGCLVGVGIYSEMLCKYAIARTIGKWTLVTLLIVVFGLACRRQSGFIVRRVERGKKGK